MKSFLNIVALLLTLNTALIISLLHPEIQKQFFGHWWMLALLYLLIPLAMFWYLKFSILPRREKHTIPKLQGLIGGYEIILDTAIVMIIEVVIYAIFIIYGPNMTTALLINAIIFIVLSAGLFVNGAIRIAVLSRQLSMTLKAGIFVLGWMPVVNLILFGYYAKVAKREYRFEMLKHELNITRIESQICKTKYPIVLVHGIFFRDWKHVNYWGRIPAELKRNGAKVYYGNQQSADSIANCALELKKTIQGILKKEKVAKVNIIAHSKGGLDARYMISKLNMAKHVASLTTVNTPNHGTPLVDKLLPVIPDKTVKLISKKYNQIFKKLGDKKPDFYTGVKELSEKNINKLNKSLKNQKGVLYQSVGSKMVSPKSTVLPLSLGYAVISFDGVENDGLVPVKSFANGRYLGTIKTKDGLGHGDMIDMTRRNLKGFDVREFYVKLVADLKRKRL